jgi:xylulokinase
MKGPFLIGVDVGTTSVKTALFDSRGILRAERSSTVATSRPAPAFVEQAPEDWISAALSGLAGVLDGVSPDAVAAIGLCSQVNTHVFVDAKGQALAPAIVWQDGRCAEDAARLDRTIAEEARLKWWGAPLPIDASHVLSRISWMARAHPDIWSRTRWVMAPKDYCLLRLTGEACADPLSSFGVVDSSLRYIDELIAVAPGAAERLPPLRDPTAIIGRVRAGLPGAGVPVVTATMDAWAGMLGAGAVRDGDAGYLSGTSEVVGIVSSRRVPAPGVIAFPCCEGITLHAGPTQAGGASVAWLGELLGRSAEEVSTLAATSIRERPAPIFLPHLQGERAPLWDIAARASFAGLDASMGAGDLARSVLEGVAYSVSLLLGALEASSAVTTKRLRHAGGGARSSVWCQIRADVLGRPIDRVECVDAGVVGAAVLAGVAAGLFGSIEEAADRMTRLERTFEPNLALRAQYDEGFGRYTDLYARLKGFGGGESEALTTPP